MLLLGMLVIAAFVMNVVKLARMGACKHNEHVWVVKNNHRLICKRCKKETLPIPFM